jgi:hypothetical protein
VGLKMEPRRPGPRAPARRQGRNRRPLRFVSRKFDSPPPTLDLAEPRALEAAEAGLEWAPHREEERQEERRRVGQEEADDSGRRKSWWSCQRITPEDAARQWPPCKMQQLLH